MQFLKTPRIKKYSTHNLILILVWRKANIFFLKLNFSSSHLVALNDWTHSNWQTEFRSEFPIWLNLSGQCNNYIENLLHIPLDLMGFCSCSLLHAPTWVDIYSTCVKNGIFTKPHRIEIFAQQSFCLFWNCIKITLKLWALVKPNNIKEDIG